MQRTNYSSGSEWESIIGYSRAVKTGNQIEVSGTVASGENGEVVGLGNAYEQTRYIYSKIEKILALAGASMSDVVRVRMFVADISLWKEYGKGHSDYFSTIKPCNTMVQVAMIDPAYLVEIEVSAVICSTV